MTHPSKSELFARGIEMLQAFCALNSLPVPEVLPQHPTDWPFRECAFYRPTYIKICVPKCAHVGVAGMAWSYPGYAIDRTPYGVVAHELGHHADMTRSTERDRYMGNYSREMFFASREPKLTNYCPNTGEWFAEMFRLFVTNPDLLRILRPKTYELIRKDFTPAEGRDWFTVLRDAPPRTLEQVSKKAARV